MALLRTHDRCTNLGEPHVWLAIRVLNMCRQPPTTDTQYSNPLQITQAPYLFKSAMVAMQIWVPFRLHLDEAHLTLYLMQRLIRWQHLATLDDRTLQVLQPPLGLLCQEIRGHSLEKRIMTNRTGILQYHCQVLRLCLLHHLRDQGAPEATLIQNRVDCVKDLPACSLGTVILKQSLPPRKVFNQESLRDPRYSLSGLILVARLDLERHLRQCQQNLQKIIKPPRQHPLR